MSTHAAVQKRHHEESAPQHTGPGKSSQAAGVGLPLFMQANPMAGAGVTLQRKCACGGTPGANDECETCNSGKFLQAKLAIGASDDPLEQEADRVADQVLARPANSTVSAAPPRIQRYTGQTTGETGTAPAPASVDRVLASAGRPLDTTLQQDMGQRFGHDFSLVRVHSGSEAEQSARDVSAHAYTVGNNVVFGEGRFAPESQAGRHLLAHELTHVVQQSGAAGIRNEQGAGKRGLFLSSPPIVINPMLQRLGDLSSRPAALDSRCLVPPDTPSSTEFVEFENDDFLLALVDPLLIPNIVLNWHSSGGNQTVRVDGFASDAGTDESNWELSCARAETLVAALTSTSSSGPGIPRTAIVSFAHGETNEFGSAERNRRASISLPGNSAPTPSPDPLTTSSSAPAPRTDVFDMPEDVRRQIDCVCRLGARSTMSRGSRRTTGIASDNAFCRLDTGYIGEDIAPSGGECRAAPFISRPVISRPVISGCTPSETRMVDAYLLEARSWINYAEPLVRAFYADPASMTPLDRDLVSSVLAANFHATSPDYVHTIATNMNALRTAINGSLEISCRDPAICAPPVPLAGSLYNRDTGYSGSFSLCGPWFGPRYHLIRVSTILHETAHARVGLGTDEDHYEDVNPHVYRDLPPETATDNPDSYAVTARQIFHRGSYGPNLVVMPGEPPRRRDAP